MSLPYGPPGVTVTVAATASSSAETFLGLPRGPMTRVRIFNASAAPAHVRFGASGLGAATTADNPIAPGTVETTILTGDESFVRVILASGSGNVHFTLEDAGQMMAPAETISLVSRMTASPSPSRIRDMDTLIGTLKGQGIWAKLDALWMLAAHSQNESLLNWKSSSFNCTIIGTPTFTVDRGWTGAAASALGTGLTLTAGGLNAVQDSHHLYVYVNNIGVAAGVIEAGSNDISMGVRQPSDLFTTRSASTTQDTVTLTTPSGLGGFVISRQSAASYSRYRNAVSQGDQARTSAAFSAVENYLLARNNGTSVTAPSSRRLGAASIGAGLSAAEVAVLYNATTAYLTALGAS